MLGKYCASDLTRYVTVSSWPARLACKNSFTRSHLLNGEPSVRNRLDLMQSCMTMRIIEVNIQIRVSVKQLGYFAFLTQCSIRQQSIFGWFTVMPAAPVPFIFRCFGHVSQDAALYSCRNTVSCEKLCPASNSRATYGMAGGVGVFPYYGLLNAADIAVPTLMGNSCISCMQTFPLMCAPSRPAEQLHSVLHACVNSINLQSTPARQNWQHSRFITATH